MDGIQNLCSNVLDVFEYCVLKSLFSADEVLPLFISEVNLRRGGWIDRPRDYAMARHLYI